MTANISAGALRARLSVPGSDEHKMAKALASEADEIVLDLEDAVAATAKADARERVTAWLARAPEAGPWIAVRVNAPRTPWCHEDVVACARQGTRVSVVLPKVESAGDLAFVDRLLAGAEAAVNRVDPVPVQALIETAAGLANLREIVTATPRLTTLIIGYADLAASLGRAADAPAETWLRTQDEILTAARGAGLAAVDGPYLGVAADEEFAGQVRRAARLGFDGKWVIHPRQIAQVNEAFTPSPDEVARARTVLTALERGHARAEGAVVVDGHMVDEAVAVAARRILARVGRATA
ncbi:HpcH/HpaI aldolase/citrate lyase family protein [Streptomyces caniscabiei]|uniref:CoA ester lyase n=1 Tax=Streptomyces caniscabiei TaxID=2746961 RepID=A0ABU4N3L6_9ACTN|nr:CoA ester lyase [Streptomyces caniscabiei]MDX2948594.1 CoA ester lyase [Streptomyces caniscabiei]MDX2957809.1 CoA ester lyase [Streptomyces caniscabiei]MDX2991038.1 CoA ester lyase [Streptomyces caniscabiei]MDX3015899.1 CoA ester lyase [Streptomyces caniscabiei]MDX3043941.1 CoA ester lyase [Streptomyces caniscabiei]